MKEPPAAIGTSQLIVTLTADEELPTLSPFFYPPPPVSLASS
jgi:hypothetical protein